MPRRFFALLALLLGAASTSVADEPKVELRESGGRKTVWVIEGESSILIGDIKTLPRGTKLYHWSEPERAERWAKQGRVDAGEIEYFVRNGDGLVGGGVYVSRQPLDSSHYGTRLSIFETERDLLYLDAAGIPPHRSWNESLPALRRAGIDSIHVPGSRPWLSLIAPNAITRARAAIFDDIAETALRGNVSLNDLVELDQKVRITDHPALRERAPWAAKLLAGTPLSSAEESEVWAHLSGHVSRRTSELTGPETPFRKALVSRFKDRIRERLAMELAGPAAEGVIEYAAKLGILYDELMGKNVATPSRAFGKRWIPVPDLGKLSDPFGQKLLTSFQFIDLNDLLVEMARGNTEPWRRYDEAGKRPLLDRWKDAVKADGLIGKYRALAAEPDGTFRDHPIVAGGDVRVPGETHGYYRVTAKQRQVLEANPYLVVTIRPDPRSPNGTTFLARHEYPSARTFAKFKSLLSENLRGKLEKASKARLLTSPATPSSRELTRSIIQELASKAMGRGGHIEIYQALMAVHPFSDYNGRTLRAWYADMSGSPLFMRNWDNDLLLTREELLVESYTGRQQYKAITEGLIAAQAKNPTMPKFYDALEPWMVAADVEQVDDPKAFLERARAWYANPANAELIRKKFYQDAFDGLQKDCLPDRLKGLLRSFLSPFLQRPVQQRWAQALQDHAQPFLARDHGLVLA